MSSQEEDTAALKGEIAELQACFLDANTPQDLKNRLLEAITAKQNTLTEMIKLSAPARADPAAAVTPSSENTAFQAPQTAQALDNALIDRIRSSVLSLSNINGVAFATVIVWDYTDSKVLLLTNYHTWNSDEYKYCFPPKLPTKKSTSKPKASLKRKAPPKLSTMKSTSKPKASLKRKAQVDEDEVEDDHVELTLRNNDFEHKFIVTSDVFHSWENDEDFAVLMLPKAGFTMPRIPVSLGISLTLKIHAFGYVGHTQQFNVSGGEISGLFPEGFVMNLLSAGGYSGAAIIADSCGRAVGYMCGNLAASKDKNSQHQSYGFRFDRVIHATGRQLTPTNSPAGKGTRSAVNGAT